MFYARRWRESSNRMRRIAGGNSARLELKALSVGVRDFLHFSVYQARDPR